MQLTLVTPNRTSCPAGPRLGPRFQDLCLQQGIRVVTQAALYLDHRTGHLVLDGGIYIQAICLLGCRPTAPHHPAKDDLSQDGAG